MTTHIIQGADLFGPDARRAELLECQRRNADLFDEHTRFRGRPTFTELFRMCRPGRVNIIANADIYFERLAHMPAPGEVWALSRWDVDPTGAAVLWNHLDSQDAWIVADGPHDVEAPFAMGVPGCDNALIHILRMAGYTVRNPSLTVKAYHLHLSQYRSYLDAQEGKGRGGAKLTRIAPPYGFSKPEEL